MFRHPRSSSSSNVSYILAPLGLEASPLPGTPPNRLPNKVSHGPSLSHSPSPPPPSAAARALPHAGQDLPACPITRSHPLGSAQQHLLQGAFPAFPRQLVVPSPCRRHPLALVTGRVNTLLPNLRPQQTGGSLGAVLCFGVMSQHCTWQEFDEFVLNKSTGEQLKPPAPVKGSKAPQALCPEETPLPGTPSMAALFGIPGPTQGPWLAKVLRQQGAWQCSGDHGTAPFFLCFRRWPKTDWPLGAGVVPVHMPLLPNSLPKTHSRQSVVSTCSNALNTLVSLG